jgi:hypothetical protein
MTYQLNLPPALEVKLRERAAAVGKDAESFIIQTLTDKLDSPASFREIFAPLHQGFAEFPIVEDELAKLVDQVREDRYRRLHDSTIESP